MMCEVCGLDNDPTLRYCDNCENPLPDSATTVISAQPPPVPRPRPVPVAEIDDDYDDDDRVPIQPGFQDRLVEPRPLTRPLLAGVAVLVVAGAVGGLMLARDKPAGPSAGPGPAPAVSSSSAQPATEMPTTGTPATEVTSAAADPQAQGAELDRLLGRSKQSRDKLNRAIKAVDGCSGLSGAIGRMREVGEERAAEREALLALDLSAITVGESARGALRSAFEHSLAADGYYVQWAEEKQRNGCRNTSVARSYDVAGDRESEVAGAAKQQFLDLWNPAAAQLGLQTRDRQ